MINEKSMKPKEIQELLDFIAKSGLDEVNIETEQFKISVKKHGTHGEPPQVLPLVNTPQITLPVITQPVQPVISPLQGNPQPPSGNPVVNPPTNPLISETSNYLTIKSPMIGTFYRSSGPDVPPFAEVGADIGKGQVVCIIEAMKLFNEIEAEYSGKVVKVLVDNASPVEYDQPLFLIDPS
jgi:acetyl-CoA carboxylase biotin carboxyl carrier protein